MKWNIRTIMIDPSKLRELLDIKSTGVVTQRLLEMYGLRLEGYRGNPVSVIVSGHRENVDALLVGSFSSSPKEE